MTAHVVDMQTQIQIGHGADPTAVRYRWRCSCGAVAKQWHASGSESGSTANAARRARNGGARHVAAQERGK